MEREGRGKEENGEGKRRMERERGEWRGKEENGEERESEEWRGKEENGEGE